MSILTPSKVKDSLHKSTMQVLCEVSDEINGLDSLGKINTKEKNYAFSEMLNKVGFADIRSSLNIENITLRIGQTEELMKVFQMNQELKKTDVDITNIRGSREALNSLDASEFIKVVKDESLTSSLIKDFHHKIMSGTNLEDAHVGVFRKSDVSVQKGELGELEVTDPLFIAEEVAELCNIFNHHLSEDPIILGAWLQHELSKIHPFKDGNGRTVRKITDWCLSKFNYFPFHIGDISKSKYYDLLYEADDGDYNPLINHIADLQLENIEIYKSSIEKSRKSRKILFDDVLTAVGKKNTSRKDVDYAQWRSRYRNITRTFTELCFEWNEQCQDRAIESKIMVYPKKLIESEKWTDILKNGSSNASTAFNIDFLEVKDGRHVQTYCGQAYFSKHLSQLKIKDHPDEVKIGNSMSPFTETVGLYFGGFEKIYEENRFQPFYQKYIQQLRNRRIIYKTPVNESKITLRGIVQVHIDGEEKLYKYSLNPEHSDKKFEPGGDNKWQWDWVRSEIDGSDITTIASEYIKEIAMTYLLKE